MMDSAPGNEIKVAIRVRPLLPKEKAAGQKSRWQITKNMISPDSTQSSSSSYVFDNVFDQNVSCEEVYEEIASDIVKQAMTGINATIFAYGQSGSGKTFTIDALRTFAIKTVYNCVEDCPAREFLLRVSYMELYNEKLTDLLSDDHTTLVIREDKDRTIYIDGLKELIVTSQDQVEDVLSQGNARRIFATKDFNDRSSRAHCIFCLVVESREREDPEHSPVWVSCLNLVDLAGSERAGEYSGQHRREGIAINMSLMNLCSVIRKLSMEQRPQFVNYRDSKLTRILQNALEGNSKTAILCTVTPSSVDETHSTLKFALTAKRVKTNAQQNVVLTETALLRKAQLEITSLKARLQELEGRQEREELQQRQEEYEEKQIALNNYLCVSTRVRKNRGLEQKLRKTVCEAQIDSSAELEAGKMSIATSARIMKSPTMTEVAHQFTKKRLFADQTCTDLKTPIGTDSGRKPTESRSPELENERFCNEKAVFQREREIFEEEKEALQREKLMLHEEKESLREKFERLSGILDDLRKRNLITVKEHLDIATAHLSHQDLDIEKADFSQQDSKKEEAAVKQYADIDEKMQAVIQQENSPLAQDGGCVEQEESACQPGSEDLTVQLQQLEDQRS